MTEKHPAAVPHKRRKGGRKHFSRARKRLREIERIIKDRHGHVPATDDADRYLGSVANCFRKIAADRGRPNDTSRVRSVWLAASELRPSGRKGINHANEQLCLRSEVTWIDVVASLAGRQFRHRSLG
jgi:hypothetical protein